MVKKANKQSTPKYDSKREQNVLLEKIYSEVKTIGEGHTVLNSKIDRIDSDIQQVKSILGSVQSATLENSHDIKTLKKGQEEIKQKLDTVTKDHNRRFEKLEAIR